MVKTSKAATNITDLTDAVSTPESPDTKDDKNTQENTTIEISDQSSDEGQENNKESNTASTSVEANKMQFELWSSLATPEESMQLNKEKNTENSNNNNNQSVQQLEPSEQNQLTLAEPRNEQSAEKEKPPVGSPEWHKLRRENHKQVERRRRETINEGINEIARIVPGCEKNKGSILQRAAVYIRQLKEAEAATVEKWTLEKLLTDQAISELNRQVELLKSELDRTRLENSYLKRELESANHHSSPKKQKLDREK